MLGENGDDIKYAQPLPYQLGSLGTYEERGAYLYVPAETQDSEVGPADVRHTVSGGVSAVMAK